MSMAQAYHVYYSVSGGNKELISEQRGTERSLTHSFMQAHVSQLVEDTKSQQECFGTEPSLRQLNWLCRTAQQAFGCVRMRWWRSGSARQNSWQIRKPRPPSSTKNQNLQYFDRPLLL